MTLKSLANKIRVDSTYGKTALPYERYDDWQRKAHPYRVTLRYQGRRLTVDYFMGEALTHEPTAEDVIDSLLLDATSGDQDFETFCAELGYDADSRKAERIYKACAATAPKVRRLLGSDFESFLYADR